MDQTQLREASAQSLSPRSRPVDRLEQDTSVHEFLFLAHGPHHPWWIPGPQRTAGVLAHDMHVV